MKRIPTRTRGPISRGIDALWLVCAQRQWIPLAIVAALLAAVGSPLLN